MRERDEAKPNSDSQGSNTVLRRTVRHRLPANNKQREYRFAGYFHSDDGRSGINQHYLTREEFTYRVAIIFTSFGTAGVGIGQCLSIIFSR